MPPTYTHVEYSDMIEMFYTSGKSTVQTCRLYLQKFPERRQPIQHNHIIKISTEYLHCVFNIKLISVLCL